MMVYLLVDVLKPAGSMAPQTRDFLEGGQLPKMGWLLEMRSGFTIRRSPLNISFLLALVCAFLVWVLIWRTRLGYEIRTQGPQPEAPRAMPAFRRDPHHHHHHADLRRARRHDGAQPRDG
jgi:ABC-type uncharacterized transport system permease subunit